MNPASVFFSKKQTEYVVAVDASGNLESAYHRNTDGSFAKTDLRDAKRRKNRCWLAIPPGCCVVRSLQLSEVSQKDVLQAVKCYAESSLLHPYDDGYVAVRTAKLGACSLAVLFWCEKKFLDACVSEVERTGYTVRGILVPELLLGRTESCLFFYENAHDDLLLCHASPQSPPIVQCGLPGGLDKDALLGAVLQEVRGLGAPEPVQFVVWQRNIRADSPVPGLSSGEGQTETPCLVVKSWADILPSLAPGKETRIRLPFAECLHRDNQQALDARGYGKMFAFLAAGLFLLAAFAATLYAQLEGEVSLLQKEAAHVTRASQKAAKATQLIRNLQEKNKTIRKFAQEKPYSLELLKIIADATSTESRLESVSITRDGRIVINGISKDASHATAIVKKLEESPRIVQCKLTSLEHVAESKEYKFTIQGRSEAWTAFFEENPA